MELLEESQKNDCVADEFVGKRVVDREGIKYGEIKHIHINSKTLTVSGVTIHQGFHNDYFLSADYIDNFTKDRKSTRLNSSHSQQSRMPSSA